WPPGQMTTPSAGKQNSRQQRRALLPFCFSLFFGMFCVLASRPNDGPFGRQAKLQATTQSVVAKGGTFQVKPKRRRTKWYSAAFAVMIVFMFLSVPLLQGVPLQEIPQYFAGLINDASPTGTSEEDTLPDLTDGEAAIYFLDVGQADCTVVMLPNGK